MQNLPVPFDRRVWLECQALRRAGYSVSVVCPKGPGDPSEEILDGVVLYKYRQLSAEKLKAGFFLEYLYSFLATARLTVKAWRRRRFNILQACNPPDIFWPLALLFRYSGRVQFVFDHHDLCPELFESRFPNGPRYLRLALRFTEWCTFRTADHIISTNESYRRVALSRGKKALEDVTVVRTGPDTDRLIRQRTERSWRQGRQHLVAYIGVMGPQDGVELALHAAHHIVFKANRKDMSFVFIGSGDCFGDLVTLSEELGLNDYVRFVGRVPDDVVSSILSTADVGLCPDPKNPLNDVSTMNKTMEYMAYSLPVVAFDLLETRVSAGDAALYAEPNESSSLAQKILQVVDDEVLARSMATKGRQRVVEELAWQHQVKRYLEVYNELCPLDPPEPLDLEVLPPTGTSASVV